MAPPLLVERQAWLVSIRRCDWRLGARPCVRVCVLAQRTSFFTLEPPARVPSVLTPSRPCLTTCTPPEDFILILRSRATIHGSSVASLGFGTDAAPSDGARGHRAHPATRSGGARQLGRRLAARPELGDRACVGGLAAERERHQQWHERRGRCVRRCRACRRRRRPGRGTAARLLARAGELGHSRAHAGGRGGLSLSLSLSPTPSPSLSLSLSLSPTPSPSLSLSPSFRARARARARAPPWSRWRRSSRSCRM